MVYYFSGTGNSTFVATTLANFLGIQKSFIPDVKPELIVEPEERFLLVFPVYSWGVPPLVIDFIRKFPHSYWERLKEKNLSVDCVMTCGDEVALAPEMIASCFKKSGIEIHSIWSVIMPNNYVLLPGFDIDSKELENKKLNGCEGRILEIAQSLLRGDKRIDVTRGSLAALKSRVIYPLFKKWGVSPRKWHYTAACISCGKCAGICPLENVKMQQQHPVWGTRCCSCLGCYHICPVHAVAYGQATRKKGQYMFPIKKISLQNYHK